MSGTGLLKIRRGPKSTLGDRAFAFCLLQFWDRVAPTTKSLAFSEIAYSQNSPGAVFKLDENSLTERLDRLSFATDGVLSYTESAGLKQVYRQQEACNGLSWLDAHYQETNPILVGM
jgi:hypothetical protein